ncbi:MAG: hypothetical protein ACREBV_08190 [Candidatus Zixiibacteriota bacterium]
MIMTRKEFCQALSFSGMAAAIPMAAKLAQAETEINVAENKNMQHRRLIAIADTELISSPHLPLREKVQGRIQTILKGSRCYICVSHEPRVYLLADGQAHSPDVLWPYRCLYGWPGKEYWYIVWEGPQMHRNSRRFFVYTTPDLYIARAEWWESLNNHAAAQADRNFAKLIERSQQCSDLELPKSLS